MTTLIQTIDSGEVVDHGGGNTFFVDSVANPVNIEIIKNGRVIDTLDNVITGTQWQPGNLPVYGENCAFDNLRVTGTVNATAVRIHVTRSGYVSRPV